MGGEAVQVGGGAKQQEDDAILQGSSTAGDGMLDKEKEGSVRVAPGEYMDAHCPNPSTIEQDANQEEVEPHYYYPEHRPPNTILATSKQDGDASTCVSSLSGGGLFEDTLYPSRFLLDSIPDDEEDRDLAELKAATSNASQNNGQVLPKQQVGMLEERMETKRAPHPPSVASSSVSEAPGAVGLPSMGSNTRAAPVSDKETRMQIKGEFNNLNRKVAQQQQVASSPSSPQQLGSSGRSCSSSNRNVDSLQHGKSIINSELEQLKNQQHPGAHPQVRSSEVPNRYQRSDSYHDSSASEPPPASLPQQEHSDTSPTPLSAMVSNAVIDDGTHDLERATSLITQEEEKEEEEENENQQSALPTSSTSIDVPSTDPTSNDDHLKVQRKRRNIKMAVVMLVSVLTIVAVAVITAVLLGKQTEEHERDHQLEHGQYTTSHMSSRAVDIPNRISDALSISAAANNQQQVQQSSPSPAYKRALHWILVEDPMLLPADAENLVQRFVIVLFYFATTEEGPWSTCNRPPPVPPEKQTDDAPVCYLDQLLTRAGGVVLDLYESEYVEIPAVPWLSNQHECSWAGLVCSSTKNHIHSIQLDNMNLAGTLPVELVLLEHLQSVSLIRNRLRGPLPEGFASLVNLSMLNLQYNELSGPLPRDWFCHNDTLFSASEPASTMQHLHYLSLDYNPQLAAWTIPPSIALDMPSLEFFSVAGANLHGSFPTDLFQLTKLRKYSLSSMFFFVF